MVWKNLVGLILVFLFLAQAVSAAGPAAVNLGTAGNFAILSKSGISTTGTTLISGDIGVSPIAASAMTGFGLIKDSSNQFATSSLLNGKAYAADYAPPTPAKMTTAVSDMQTAYTDAAGRTTPTATELGAGNIGGRTLAPGLYKWGTGVTIPTSVTLSGGPNDVWIFQIGQNLDVGNGVSIILSGGAQAKNIFWQVAGQATLGTTSNVNGIILSKTAIVMNTGAKLNGRALAQTAVTLNANAVTAPTGTTPPTPVTCTSFTYSEWSNCNSNGQQTRTVAAKSPNGCTGGTPVLSQTCTPTVVTCTSFTYSEWSNCNSNGQQTRTVATSSPNGCTGTPELTRTCALICTGFVYSEWNSCNSNGQQTRTIISSSPSGCTGGNPSLSQTCTPVPVTCTGFVYSEWNNCVQTRTIVSKYPSGCTGGSPILTNTCTSAQAPAQTATAPQPAATTTGSTTTIASSNPTITQTPYVQQSGLSQSQIAQNLALGLPAGTVR